MKWFLFMVPLLVLCGCIRETKKESMASLVGDFRAAGNVAGAPIDLTVTTDIDRQLTSASRYESRVNVEAIKEIVGPMMKAAVAAGLSDYSDVFQAFRTQDREPAVSKPSSGYLGEHGNDIQTAILLAILGGQAGGAIRRRLRKRDEATAGGAT